MASYALLVVENFMTDDFKTAYSYLEKCYNRKDNDRCRYATSVYVLFDSLSEVKNRVIHIKTNKKITF